ncbi:hypothetical protein ACG2LH_02775 [Zhouia sp. PK063]|uniref:hypothetical protein n=1 Tax=Zhouia sp. PK063 TaxID=3373602 RepID=UPI00379E54C1
MKIIAQIIIACCCFFSSAQHLQEKTIQKDSIIIIKKQPEKGFYSDYILFLPKETPLNKKLFLLVEPNNTGRPSDSMSVHEKHAINLASVSSVGNNIATMLKIPLLVPVFPRPAVQPLVYSHALDRDVMLEKTPELHRLDLQLLAMINDAKTILDTLHIVTHNKIFMNGFSASATFTNRFSFLHPDKIEALAMGGFNGELMLPKSTINGVPLNYPIGINDFSKLFKQSFDMTTYKRIPQFIYMGKLDNNDAVQFDDAYSNSERHIINKNIGATVQNRYIHCQQWYHAFNINATFNTYENVGHWTTGEVNFEVIKFFFAQMQKPLSNSTKKLQ